MGFGGHLIWTGVFDKLAKSGEKGAAVKVPLLTDIIRGKLYRRDHSFAEDEVFRLNPDVCHVTPVKKNKVEYVLDYLFEKFISPRFIRLPYEMFVFKLSSIFPIFKIKGQDVRAVHIDMRMHSYAKKATSKKLIWVNADNAQSAVGRHFDIKIDEQNCFLHFDAEEIERVRRLLSEHNIQKPFIVFDPDTNTDWFGDLRLWPLEKWKKLISSAHEIDSRIQFVQVGLAKTGVLKGVKDLTNQTTFREAALIIERSQLFVGTEGGLMHAAAAVNKRALILWGGITEPSFAGYPGLHDIICKDVSCSPCGNLGWCHYEKKCMNDINVEEVLNHLFLSLEMDNQKGRKQI